MSLPLMEERQVVRTSICVCVCVCVCVAGGNPLFAAVESVKAGLERELLTQDPQDF
jgi:hypothetical protein